MFMKSEYHSVSNKCYGFFYGTNFLFDPRTSIVGPEGPLTERYVDQPIGMAASASVPATPGSEQVSARDLQEALKESVKEGVQQALGATQGTSDDSVSIIFIWKG